MIKSNYEKVDIQNFINKKYNVNIELKPVVEGMESQVYSYILDNIEYIIRINPSIEGFKKDKYAYEHFNSDLIPIPKIVDLGKFNSTHYYCISEKAKGITFEDSSEEIVERLLPDITRIMESINSIDISNTTGYGVFLSDTGNAPFDSWKEYLLNIINDKKYNWEQIKCLDYVDSELVEEVITKFKELLPFCKEIRKLRHGDYGANNMLVDETFKFSGVIDWDCARYGDPLYEVGSSYFWSTWLMCMEKVSKYWTKVYGHISDFDKIVKCYELHIGLEEIYENAIDKDIETLEWIQNRCREILKEI